MTSSPETALRLGLDFGSVYLRAAVINPDTGSPEILQDPIHTTHSALIPSALLWDSGRASETGWKVYQNRYRHPEKTVFHLKRLMSAGYDQIKKDARYQKMPLHWEVKQEPEIIAGQGRMTLTEAASLLIREIKIQSEKKYDNGPFNSLVLTLPERLLEPKRLLFEEASRKAGFQIVTLMSESEAALKAFLGDKKKTGLFAICNFGGCSFDVSLFECQENAYRLRAYQFHDRLGGEDLSWAMAERLKEEMAEAWGVDESSFSAEAAAQIFDVCEHAKCAVSHRGSQDIQVAEGDRKFMRAYSRFEFVSATRHLLDQTAQICSKALSEAQLEPRKIDEVYLVGGSSRILYFRELMETVFGKTPRVDLNVDQVIALGAMSDPRHPYQRVQES